MANSSKRSTSIVLAGLLAVTMLGVATLILLPQTRPDFWPQKDTAKAHSPTRLSTPNAKIPTPNTLADELTVYLEGKWVGLYEANQKRYEFKVDAPEMEMANLSDTVRKDFLKWIQFQSHEKQITELREEPIGEFPDYSLKAISFKNANGLTVEGILSVPGGGRGPYPVLVIPNGFTASATEIFGLTSVDYHFEAGKRFARDYVVLAINIPPTTNNFEKAVASSDRNFYLSNSAGSNWTYYAIVDKVSSALDYIEDVPEADVERIAIYGISMGGQAAIIASLADQRISITIPSGTNVFTPTDVQLLRYKRFRYPHYYQFNVVARPDLYQALYALFPNPIIIELNTHDTTGVFSEALESAELVKQFYEIRGVGDRVKVITIDGTKTVRTHAMEITQVKQALDELLGSRPRLH